MSEKRATEDKKESQGLALAGIVLSAVGIAAVLLPAWRTFAVICASVGLLVSVYSFFRARKTRSNTTRSIVGLFLAVLALYTAIMVLVLKHVDPPTDNPNEILEQVH